MESLAPGAQVSKVARRHNLNRGLLQTWRRQAVRTELEQPAPVFVPVCCSDDVKPLPAALPVKAPSVPPGVIEVEIGRARVRIEGAVDLDALRQVLSIIGSAR
jgi:transposase